MKARNIVVLIVILGLVGIVIFAKLQSRKTANPAASGPAVVEEGKPAWLFVHSNMCVSCKEMSKVFVRLKADRVLADKVQFVDVIFDDPANAELIRKYKVTMIPTSVILDSRGQVVAKKVGPVSQEELRKLLKAVK